MLNAQKNAPHCRQQSICLFNTKKFHTKQWSVVGGQLVLSTDHRPLTTDHSSMFVRNSYELGGRFILLYLFVNIVFDCDARDGRLKPVRMPVVVRLVIVQVSW